MQIVKKWLVENAVLLGAIASCIAITLFFMGFFKPSTPQPSAKEIAQTVIRNAE